MAGRHRSPRGWQHRPRSDHGDLGRVVGAVVLTVAIPCQALVASAMNGPADGSMSSDPQLRAISGPLSARQQAAPVAVRIPRLDVDSSLVPLMVDGTGALQPPDTADVAGWYTGSPVPGDPGPAVIAGHVDSRTGPGVFIGLRTLEPGDDVQVVRSDGRTVTFRVRSTDIVDKNSFPTASVYGPTPVSELRLITCGGHFDHRARRYLANVVVYATLA